MTPPLPIQGWASERRRRRAANLRALLIAVVLAALAAVGVARVLRQPPAVECFGIGADPPPGWAEAMRDLAGAR